MCYFCADSWTYINQEKYYISKNGPTIKIYIHFAFLNCQKLKRRKCLVDYFSRCGHFPDFWQISFRYKFQKMTHEKTPITFKLIIVGKSVFDENFLKMDFEGNQALSRVPCTRVSLGELPLCMKYLFFNF